MDCRTEGDSNIDTEGEGNGELGINDEIELVFKPHPTEMSADNQLIRALKENCVRYIKTTANATVDHLSKYLAMRLTLDLGADLPEACRLLNFCIYVAPQPQQLVILNGNQTLHQVNDKFWKVSRALVHDVSHLPGHAQEDDDDEGVPAPLLLRLHCDRPAFRQQGVPHVPQEARLQALPARRSQLRPAHLEDLPQSRGVRGHPGEGDGQVQPDSVAAGPGQLHQRGHQAAVPEPATKIPY